MAKSDPKAPTPMDPSAREGDTPTMHVPLPRQPYAMRQLISEVKALFPEMAEPETSRQNQRGVYFDVTFDLSGVDSDLRDSAVILLELLGDPAYNEDPRLVEVVADKAESTVLVSFQNNVHLMDDWKPFGLGSAWIVLTGEDQ